MATEPEDLVDFPSEVIDSLSIVATEPSVRVTLSRSTAAVEATDADMVTLGALRRIEDLMRSRRRALKKFVLDLSSGGGSVLVGALGAVVTTVLGVAGIALSNA